MGRIVESGSTSGGIGAALRMMTGTVASGRTAAVGSGRPLGIGAELGSGKAVGIETAVGRGSAVVSGTALTTGGLIVGAATVGSGPSDGALTEPGVPGAAVHAADTISAKATSGRKSNLPTSERSKSFANRPHPQRK